MAKKDKKDKKEKKGKRSKKGKAPKEPRFLYDKAVAALGGFSILYFVFLIVSIAFIILAHSFL